MSASKPDSHTAGKYHGDFLRWMVVCRYIAYGFFLLVLLSRRPIDGPLVPVLAFFVVMPGLVHFILMGGWAVLQPQPERLRWLHVVEFVLTFQVLLLFPLSLIGALALAWVFVAANTALWGLVQGTLIAALATSLYGGEWLLGWTELQPSRDLWTQDLMALLGGYGFMLLICLLANRQAQQFINSHRRLLQYLPDDLGRHMRHSRRHGIRREWLSIVFVDMVGFTRASQDLPEEALHQLVNNFLSTTSQLANQWGGFVSKFLGDGALCVFPASSDRQRQNAAVQCVRFATQLPEHLAISGQPEYLAPQQTLAVTVGVSTGFCTSGSWGAGVRWDYTVIGTPVNLASRLQAAAGAHSGILVDETTAVLCREYVPLSGAITIQLKGFAQQCAFSPADVHVPVGCKAQLC